jgi:DNA polymerase-3 subunit beta
MKVSVEKQAITNGLQLVHGVVNPRPALPILSNVLLHAEDERLWMTTTDLEITMRCAVEAKVGRKGATTLPARRLFSILRELPVDKIEIEVDDKNFASIACGASFFKIDGLSEEEFPPLPTFDGGHSYTMEQKVFKTMLQRTAYAASSDESRYILNGTLLSFKDSKLTLVATDGRRLALSEQEVEFPKEGELDIVLPTKAVNELLHGLRDEGNVKITATRNQVAFEFDEVLMISKLIEGTYPNFRQVIPSQCEQRVAVEREALLNAIRRVALLTSEKSSSVRMTFGKNKLKVSASSPDVGEAHETLPIKYTGKDIAVAFNPDFVVEPLRTLASDEVFFEMTDELSPGVLKCDVPFIYVLMPMRVS